jgi:hypothetical protein
MAVEVGFKQAILHEAVFLKFAFGVGLGDFGGDFAGILQDFAVGRGNKAI